MNTQDDPDDIKREMADMNTMQEWKNAAPDKLWDLISRKYKAHPELLEPLISTVTYPLVEGSVDKC